MQIEFGGSLVCYEEYGEGVPVLILHGHGVDRRLMTGCCEPVFEKLRGCRRIYPDLPGMGRSVAAPGLQSADDMLDVVQAFAREVAGGPYLLVGESHGGYLALGMLQRGEPDVRGAFLLCPAVVAAHAKRTLPKAEVALRLPVSLQNDADAAAFAGFEEMAAVVTPGTWARYKAEILPGVRAMDKTFIERYDRGFARQDEAGFGNIRFAGPCTVLCGRQDTSVGYEDAFKLMGAFARGTYVALDGAGHNLQIEQPEMFEVTFADWLRRATHHVYDTPPF